MIRGARATLPVLLVMDVRLDLSEECDSATAFGDEDANVHPGVSKAWKGPPGL